MQTALPPAAAPARPASEVAGPQMSCAVCPFRLRAHTLDCSLLSCLPFFFSFPLAPTSSANRLSSTSARIRLLSALRATAVSALHLLSFRLTTPGVAHASLSLIRRELFGESCRS